MANITASMSGTSDSNSPVDQRHQRQVSPLSGCPRCRSLILLVNLPVASLALSYVAC